MFEVVMCLAFLAFPLMMLLPEEKKTDYVFGLSPKPKAPAKERGW